MTLTWKTKTDELADAIIKAYRRDGTLSVLNALRNAAKRLEARAEHEKLGTIYDSDPAVRARIRNQSRET